MDPRYLVIAGLLLLLIVAAIFLFWKSRRELPVEEVPKEWIAILKKRVRYFRELSPDRQAVFAKRVQGFLGEVTINGAKTSVSLTDKLLIAASAQIPLFGFPDWHYPNIDEVVLYGANFSRDFDPDSSDRNILGMVGNRELKRAMVLSKPALHEGFGRHTDSNVGVHEFAHLLDMSDGDVDGSPDYYLEDGLVGPWMRVVEREMLKIIRGDSALDEYGATNEAEFFAVATEYFFFRPDDLKEEHPKLYGMLEDIFRQDPTQSNPAQAYRDSVDPE
ncbi:MAG: zinc-dependent peptidase [Saprospiraceae bacterium]